MGWISQIEGDCSKINRMKQHNLEFVRASSETDQMRLLQVVWPLAVSMLEVNRIFSVCTV